MKKEKLRDIGEIIFKTALAGAIMPAILTATSIITWYNYDQAVDKLSLRPVAQARSEGIGDLEFYEEQLGNCSTGLAFGEYGSIILGGAAACGGLVYACGIEKKK